MIRIPKVTLIAYGSSKYKDAQQKVLDLSCKGIRWGAVKNIIDDNCTSIDRWNERVITELPKHVSTSHCLFIHVNGWVVNPQSWSNRWLKYDFAGSPWPYPSDNYSYRDEAGNIVRVGNSVGLRSKKLLDLAAQREVKYRFGNNSEDGHIACHNRLWLESKGCKFMPLSQAVYFGRENEVPENAHVDKPFLFHNFKGKNAIYQ